VPGQLDANHEETMEEQSSAEYNNDSIDIEQRAQDTDQSRSDIDDITENIDESNEEIDQHTEDIDGSTRDVDEHTEDTNDGSESEIVDRTNNSKRGRSPVHEESYKRYRDIDTAKPSGTISIIPGKEKKRQLSQDSNCRSLRRSKRIQSSSGSSVTSYTAQRIIPATSTKKNAKLLTHTLSTI
jgi:hypothetical protein